jgi:hypothetical protein
VRSCSYIPILEVDAAYASTHIRVLLIVCPSIEKARKNVPFSRNPKNVVVAI